MKSDLLEARATGPYSLISLQPLSSHGEDFGQPVTVGHVEWLRRRGLWANLGELTVLKSDDASNRKRVASAIDGHSQFPRPSMPQSLWILQTLLRVLGIHVELRSRRRHVALRLRPATDQDIPAVSQGLVVRAETIHYRTEQPIPGGLFCREIFGESDADRRQRFGHIELPSAVVGRIWRFGSPSAIEQLTGLSDAQLRCKLRDSGAEALVPLLASRGYAETASWLLRRKILVYPPELRPLIKLESGNYATADTNDLYRRLINRARRMDKLIELEAPPEIVESERTMLQKQADVLWANCLLPAKEAQFLVQTIPDDEGRRIRQRQRLKDVLALAINQLAMSVKHVDYSGRASAAPDDSLARDQILVPSPIMTTLGLHERSPVLLTRPDGMPGTFAGAYPNVTTESSLRVSTQIHSSLRLGDSPECVIHRPLGSDAVAEAVKLAAAPMDESKASLADVDQNADGTAILERLVYAALTEGDFELNDSRGLLVGGVGAISQDAQTRRGLFRWW